MFITPNQRVLAQSDLAEALEDELYALRERLGADVFPRSALDYLNDWASPEKGWLRKFYRLQLLIVTPLQKIHVIEPFVSGVGFVHNEEGRASKLRNLSIREYREEKEKARLVG